MKLSIKNVLVVSLLSVALLTQGCASGKEFLGRTVGTIVGAAGGLIIGGAQGGVKGALVGAVARAAVGYAAGWFYDDYKMKQTKTAEQVREEYAAANQDKVPEKPTADGYVVTIDPSATVKRGSPANLVSSFDIVAKDGQMVAMVNLLLLTN